LVEKYSFAIQPNLPKIIEVPALKKEPALDLEAVKKIAQTLDFKKAPVAQNDPVLKLVFKWQEENYLSFNLLEQKVYYSYDTTKDPSVLNNGEIPNEASAQKTVEEIFVSLNLWDLNFKLIKILKSSTLGGEYLPTNDQEVNVIELWYGLFQKDLPVLTIIPDAPWLKVKITRDNKLIGFEYQKTPLVQGTLGTYSVLTTNQTLNFLNAGQGTVVSFNLDTSPKKPLTTKNILEMKIEKAKIAYLSQINQDQLVPIFVFEGKATTSDQRTGHATVYLPAIQQDFKR